jgi:hypothetical protein
MMVQQILQHLHAILPGTTEQWIGASLVIVLHFMMTRTKRVEANSFIEAIANGIMATPLIGAFFKAVPLLNVVLAYLSTPRPAPAVPEMPKPPVLPPAAMVLIFSTMLFGCGNVMSTYYRSVASAATAVSTGYRLLDKYDTDAQAVIVQLAKRDAGAADAKLKSHLAKYADVHKALDDAAFVVETARSAGPLVEAAKDRDKQVSSWVLKLTQLATNILTSLRQSGVV